MSQKATKVHETLSEVECSCQLIYSQKIAYLNILPKALKTGTNEHCEYWRKIMQNKK
jgi:hypothetical protein